MIQLIFTFLAGLVTRELYKFLREQLRIKRCKGKTWSDWFYCTECDSNYKIVDIPIGTGVDEEDLDGFICRQCGHANRFMFCPCDNLGTDFKYYKVDYDNIPGIQRKIIDEANILIKKAEQIDNYREVRYGRRKDQ